MSDSRARLVPSDPIDDVILDALKAVSGGLNLDEVGEGLGAAVGALVKQAAALKAARYEAHNRRVTCPACSAHVTVTIPETKAVDTARAMSHTGKVIDDLTRLTAFAKGQPDSRPDRGMDWLKALSEEQLKTVQGWLGQAKESEPKR